MTDRVLLWWVRLDIELESYFGPFETELVARRFADKQKCGTEVLQDANIDNGYLELTGGSLEGPTRYIVFRSGKVVPFSPETLLEWVEKDFAASNS